MKAKYKIGQKIKISDNTDLSGLFGTITEVDISEDVVRGKSYYRIDLDNPFTTKSGYEFISVGRSETEITV